jgi:hypothetical protein
MPELDQILLLLKYAICIYILLIIICAPAWLARQTKKNKQDMILVRLGSWLFLWSGVGWLWSLYWSVKK